MFKKRELILLSRDRLAMTLLAATVLGVVLLFVLTALNVRMSDVQVPIRYSEYGFTNLYRDKWYALLSFGLFALIILATNGYLAIKLHSARRGVALGLLSLTLVMTVITLIIANAVFRLAALSL